MKSKDKTAQLKEILLKNKEVDSLINLIFPEYENELLKIIEEENHKHKISEDLFVILLLKYDYDKYIDFIKERILSCSLERFHFYKKILFSHIKDNYFAENVYYHKMKEWFSYRIIVVNHKNINLSNHVISYLMAGHNFENLKEELINFKNNGGNSGFDEFESIFYNDFIFNNDELKKRVCDISEVIQVYTGNLESL